MVFMHVIYLFQPAANVKFLKKNILKLVGFLWDDLKIQEEAVTHMKVNSQNKLVYIKLTKHFLPQKKQNKND